MEAALPDALDDVVNELQPLGAGMLARPAAEAEEFGRSGSSRNATEGVPYSAAAEGVPHGARCELNLPNPRAAPAAGVAEGFEAANHGGRKRVEGENGLRGGVGG